jgi:hypothetical protein
MDARFRALADQARRQHGAVSTAQLEASGVHRRLRSAWTAAGLLERRGARSYVIAGSTPTWRRELWCAAADVDGAGFLAGRAAAQLHGLDGFRGDSVELLVRREHKGLRTPFVLRSTAAPLSRSDTVCIDGLRCLTAERTILESALFGFTREEMENAVDSAIRLRLVSEQRLRTRLVAGHRRGVNGSGALLATMVDTGGESRLERWFLRLVREAGLPRPQLRRVVRDGNRTVARVDAWFGGGLVVEIEGHGTHSTRQQRQHDEQRRTELTLRGHRVIVFTYSDIRDRPDWAAGRLRTALLAAA